MSAQIVLESRHRTIVQAILCEYLPVEANVWVFGSRATGKVWRGSDLDLVIDIGQQLSSSLESTLYFAFEDSDLPWMVDIIDMQRLQDGIFRQNVERDRVVLDWRGAGDGE